VGLEIMDEPASLEVTVVGATTTFTEVRMRTPGSSAAGCCAKDASESAEAAKIAIFPIYSRRRVKVAGFPS